VHSYKTLDVLLPTADPTLIETASTAVFDRFWGMSMRDLRQVDVAEMRSVAYQLRDLLLELPFQLPEALLLLGRTVAILSGMCTGLDPEFNLWTTVAPYAAKLVAAEGGSSLDILLAQATKLLQVLLDLPGRADRVLTMMERGELAVQTPVLNRRVWRLEQSVNRTAAAVVFAALLLAGAMLYQVEPGYAKTMMGVSTLPLVWIVFFGRGR
jgi:predicted unusual protein kinase regulating ubiquinone biosynthesis (AarF/ABC1/UbiB family)